MIQKPLLILALFLISFSSFAQTGLGEFPVDIPNQVNEEIWVYNLYKNVFYDIDKSLQESGVSIEFCSYREGITGKTTSYKKLGNCLYSHFVDSMRIKDQAGIIYFWIKDSKKNLVPVRLDWKPTDEGWRGTFRELLTLNFEPFSKFWIKMRRLSKEEVQPTSFKKNFLGRMTLRFPPGTSLTNTFLDENDLNSFLRLDQAHELSFEMNPIGKKNGEVHYEGKILVSHEAKANPSGDIVTINFATNINFLKSSRTYFMKGKSGSDFQIEEGKLP